MKVRERASWIVVKVAWRDSVTFGPTARKAPAMHLSARPDVSVMVGSRIVKRLVTILQRRIQMTCASLASHRSSSPFRHER